MSPTDLTQYKQFIFGHQKIGKTSLTAQYENALHFFFEPSGTDYELFAVEPKDWGQFVEYIDLLEEQKEAGTLEYKNFIVDVVDIAYDQCLAFVCGKQGLTYPPQNDFGRTWKDIKDEFRRQVIRLARLGGAIFVSHVKEKNIEQKNGMVYTRMEPSCAKGAFEVLSKWCDLTAYYRASDDGEGREIRISPTAEFEAGNRMDKRFKYSNGKPMDRIDMGSSAEEGMENLLSAFRNETVDPDDTSKMLLKVKAKAKAKIKAEEKETIKNEGKK